MMLIKKLLSVHQYIGTYDRWDYAASRSFHYLAYNLTSKGIHKLANRDLTVNPGEMIFLNGDEPYQVFSDTKNTSYVVSFEAEGMPPSFVLSDIDIPKVKNIWEHLMHHRNLNLEENVYYCMGKLYELFSYTKHVSLFHELSRNDTKTRLLRAQLYIMEHYDDPGLCTEVVAAQLGISTNYFGTVFKNEFQVTPYQFLIEIRMKEAMRLLDSSNKTVGEIAENVGYLNFTNFSRAFRQHTGMTPREYRFRGSI